MSARRDVIRLEQAYRTGTAGLRALPDFLIIGAQKAGTTSLYRYLTRHPDVRTPPRRLCSEVHYFDRNYSRGTPWYRSHFPFEVLRRLRWPIRGSFKVGEKSPYYLYHPLAPSRVGDLLPDVKLIALLRNPISRAFSHYVHQRRKGREPLSFDDAVRSEEDRLRGETNRVEACPDYHSFAHQHFSYLDRGIYVDQLARWMRHVPRSQMLILRSEDFFESPRQTYADVLEFLRLRLVWPRTYPAYNASKGATAMHPATRERLREFFTPHNERLYAFLGRDFGWS